MSWVGLVLSYDHYRKLNAKNMLYITINIKCINHIKNKYRAYIYVNLH